MHPSPFSVGCGEHVRLVQEHRSVTCPIGQEEYLGGKRRRGKTDTPLSHTRAYVDFGTWRQGRLARHVAMLHRIRHLAAWG